MVLCDGDEVGGQPSVDNVGHEESLGTFIRLGNDSQSFVCLLAVAFIVVVLVVVLVVALNLSYLFCKRICTLQHCRLTFIPHLHLFGGFRFSSS